MVNIENHNIASVFGNISFYLIINYSYMYDVFKYPIIPVTKLLTYCSQPSYVGGILCSASSAVIA